jgi:phage terminase large subunit
MKQIKISTDDLLKTIGDPYRNPRQIEFLKAASKYVAYGGSKGGGKSFAARYKATGLCLTYPGIKVLIIRRTLSELRENHIIPLRSTYNKWPKFVQPKYNDDEKAFSFCNGSRLKLGYCDNENDVLQYQGQEYDVIFLEEATQLTEFQFSWLDSCLRGVNDFPKRMYLTCNPGGVGHGWVKRLFIDREYRAEESKEDYEFISAKVWDNQPLFDSDAGYIKALKQYCLEHELYDGSGKDIILKPDEDAIWYAKNKADYVVRLKNLPYHLREAWLNGRWDVFAGQFFGEFHRDTHTCEPFEIPRHWRKTRAIDYGLDMLAVLWVATDEHGNSWIYRELNRPDLAVSLAADAIKRATPPDEYIEATYAPPDLWSRGKDTGIPQAETFAINGVPLVKSSNDREKGWLSVKEWFKATKDGDTYTKPKLVIFRTCPQLIKHIPLLQHDENKTNDVATEPHDITHNTDALRYWCARRQLTAEISEEPFKSQWKHEDQQNDSYFDSGEVTEEYICG